MELMALSSKIIKRVMRANTSDVIHSSGYARAQSGAAFGATSAESFKKLQKIERNRKHVQGYGQSRVAQHTRTVRPSSASAPTSAKSRPGTGNRQAQ